MRRSTIMPEIPPFQISLPDQLTDSFWLLEHCDIGVNSAAIANQITQELTSVFDSTTTSGNGNSRIYQPLIQGGTLIN